MFFFQELQLHAGYSRYLRDNEVFRVPHFCTPSTSNTTSTLAGAGEALSSTSELFHSNKNRIFMQSTNDLPDETKVFRQLDEIISIECPRDVSHESSSEHPENLEVPNETMLEDDKQSDHGYGTTSECASEVRNIRRVHSDSDIVVSPKRFMCSTSRK